jgi:S-adenosylmethionine/arginine decarboxylase-like enzyme
VDPQFTHRVVELTSLAGTRLADADGVSSMVVAAAGAVGMPALGPPIVRAGPAGVAVALLCRDGHIVVHTIPAEGRCFVAVVARDPADPGRGIDVITRGFSRDTARREP